MSLASAVVAGHVLRAVEGPVIITVHVNTSVPFAAPAVVTASLAVVLAERPFFSLHTTERAEAYGLITDSVQAVIRAVHGAVPAVPGLVTIIARTVHVALTTGTVRTVTVRRSARVRLVHAFQVTLLRCEAAFALLVPVLVFGTFTSRHTDLSAGDFSFRARLVAATPTVVPDSSTPAAAPVLSTCSNSQS